MKAKLLYERAISQWGYKAQLAMALEEIIELSFELIKFMRKENDWRSERIEDEVADVEIMMAQLRLIFNTENISRIKAKKLRRLQGRLENAYNSNK